MGHDVAVDSVTPDCVAYVPDSRFDEDNLLIEYDPSNGDAWLASDEPCHLRQWA
ncbi:hypothetical protein [Halobellus rubicundus]|uniref:Uncharacterized protein n=1 Tax=Halobellus rubicundus TaxID=2996466 RepID=A0ABD5MFJ2_9EURY